MGANLCCLRDATAGHDKSKSNNQDSDEQKNPCGGTVARFVNPRGLSAAVKTNKTESLKRGKKLGPQLQVCKNRSSSKALTLEDMFKTSPGFVKGCNDGGSDYSAAPANCKQSSKRIHPSFDGDDQLEAHGKGQLENSPFCKISKSGKRLKKKVSFRSPEVADVFVMDSPVVYVNV